MDLELVVAVPVLGAAPYLAEALRSLATINIHGAVYVVRTPSASAGVRACFADLEGDVRFQLQEGPDAGQADAINRVWRQYSARSYSWVNDDDIVMTGFLKSHGLANMGGEPRVCYGDYDILGGDGSVRRSIYTPRRVSRTSLLRSRCQIPGIAPIMNRACLDDVGFLNEELKYAFDLEYWLRVLEAGGDLIHSGQKVGGWREHAQSKTVANPLLSHAEAMSVRSSRAGTVRRLWPLTNTLGRAVRRLERIRVGSQTASR